MIKETCSFHAKIFHSSPEHLVEESGQPDFPNQRRPVPPPQQRDQRRGQSVKAAPRHATPFHEESVRRPKRRFPAMCADEEVE